MLIEKKGKLTYSSCSFMYFLKKLHKYIINTAERPSLQHLIFYIYVHKYMNIIYLLFVYRKTHVIDKILHFYCISFTYWIFDEKWRSRKKKIVYVIKRRTYLLDLASQIQFRCSLARMLNWMKILSYRDYYIFRIWLHIFLSHNIIFCFSILIVFIYLISLLISSLDFFCYQKM